MEGPSTEYRVPSVRRVPIETIHAIDTGALIGWLTQTNWRLVSRRFPDGYGSRNDGEWATPEQLEEWSVEWERNEREGRIANRWYNRLLRRLKRGL